MVDGNGSDQQPNEQKRRGIASQVIGQIAGARPDVSQIARLNARIASGKSKEERDREALGLKRLKPLGPGKQLPNKRYAKGPRPDAVASRWPRACGRPGQAHGDTVPLETLHAIARLQREHGRAPKRKEIAALLGLKSIASAIARVHRLKRRGLATFDIGSLYTLRLTTLGTACLALCPRCGSCGDWSVEEVVGVEGQNVPPAPFLWSRHKCPRDAFGRIVVVLNPIEREAVAFEERRREELNDRARQLGRFGMPNEEAALEEAIANGEAVVDLHGKARAVAAQIVAVERLDAPVEPTSEGA